MYTPAPPQAGRYPYTIRSGEIDGRDRARLAAVCHLLQESAGRNAHELKASPEQLLERGMTWFLARMRLRVERLPLLDDEVTVETWPSEIAPPFVHRDFRLFDARDEEMAAATTSWLLVDMGKRRPMRRFPQEIIDLHPGEPVEALSHATVRLPLCEEPEHVTKVEVRDSDVDINQHVNHVFYIDQVEQSVPAATREGLQIEELVIEYKVECHTGDRLTVRTQRMAAEEPAFIHSLVRQGDQREVVRARTRWRA